MNLIQPRAVFALALVAGGLSAVPAAAHAPRVSTPSLQLFPTRPPTFNPSGPVRDAVDAARRRDASHGRSDGGKKSDSKGRANTAGIPETIVLIGPDGKPVTLVVIRHQTDLSANVARTTLENELTKYGSPDSWWTNYKPVDPDSKPTRMQDCAGNALEQLWGIKNVVVNADNFYNNVVRGTNAKEVVRITKDGSIDWSKVQDKDVGVMFGENGGGAGHIFVVKDASSGTITTKDGPERVYEGKLSPGDKLHNGYRGDIGIYRIDPSSIKVSKK